MFFYYFSIFIIILLVFLRIYFAIILKWCTNKVCLNGKTVIVTGANTGIGLEASLEFAKRGARVILACRDLKKAEIAKDRIISLTENNNVKVMYIDFSSLDSVRDFAKSVKENEERLDILVNNAAAGTLKNKISDDGLQVLMQINYFGPFLLTILLLDLIKKTGSSRIINVSSVMAATSANLTVKNMSEWPGSHIRNYSNSKLANILFTIKLADLLKGTNVTTYSLHPGAIKTEIFRNIRGLRTIVLDFCWLFFKTPEEGAQTTIYTATEQGIENQSGEHFDECQKVERYQNARDPNLVEGIWQETIKLLQCEKEVEELFS